MQGSPGEMKNYQIGFILLILFCFFRPLSLIYIKTEIAGLNFFEIFAILISYLLLIAIAFNIRKMKFDFISFSILWFCSICYISIFWGSEIDVIARVTLPFIIFFAIRVMIEKPEQIKLLLTVLIIAYCVLVFGSFYRIIQGSSIGHVESITGIERHAGLFKKIHPFSYTMFFMSVYFYMQVFINKLRNRHIICGLLFLLIISIFCLYKTYARNSYLGLFSFWIITLWGYKKKYIFVFFILLLLSGMLYLADIQQIFFKTREFDFNTASSGRLMLWEHNINFFLESSFDRKLLGHGLGVGSKRVIGTEYEIWSSHNNYLHLLLQLGVVGLVAYLLIFIVLLKDIYFSSIDKITKFFYYGFIFSILLMNLTSDATLFNVGISQQFWMVMGFLYVFRDFNATSSHSV